MNRTYLTLEDLVKELGFIDDVMQSLEIGEPTTLTGLTILEILIEHYFDELTSVPAIFKNDVSGKCKTNDLFCTYVYPRFKDIFITYYDGAEPTDDEKKELFKDWLTFLLNRMRRSYDEYAKLIELYEGIKNNLLDEIKTQTKFDDSPQTQTSGGVTTYDDTYNTTVSTIYSDGASKIARLKEIESYITDYYQKWADEVCKGVFIYD